MFLELYNRIPDETKMELLDVFANRHFRAMLDEYHKLVVEERNTLEPTSIEDKEFIKHCIVLRERLLILEELDDFLKAGRKLLANHNI